MKGCFLIMNKEGGNPEKKIQVNQYEQRNMTKRYDLNSEQMF